MYEWIYYLTSISHHHIQVFVDIFIELQIKNEHNFVKIVNSISASDTYVRWGRNSCPADNELVYKGKANDRVLSVCNIHFYLFLDNI